ncbi:hypothetical protein AYJ57_19920 [Salipiger sp. CCB-MM3]|uniref:LysR family transcriptional regulator n=1 Tax=Roseobacteraceae TaxID=2854170 RepID=UPI00080ABF1F|nr:MULTISPECIES: LysR family transcriptional regulator [Roseobacteraceae]ANT62647.1 hypothetical protein AYJ57_19920 [Salipiger sp. CCB-MM3]MCA0996826.1 LysR family transcriptional regulator [Alloyangia pacifica]
MDKFAELRAFTHVMDHGGFTAAAEALGMSKAAVSKNVAALERRLGLKLFERTTRQVRPTTEGNHYYRWTRQLLAEADWADTCARALAEPQEAALRIAAPAELVEHMILPRLGRFLASHPDGSVVFEPAGTEGCDMSISTEAGDVMDGRPLAVSTHVVVASSLYLATQGRPNSASDLASHRLLHLPSEQESVIWTLTDRRGADTPVTTERRIELSDTRTVLEACLAGLGIACLPDFVVARDLGVGRLTRVLPDYDTERRVVVSRTEVGGPARELAMQFEAYLDTVLREQGAPISGRVGDLVP